MAALAARMAGMSILPDGLSRIFYAGPPGSFPPLSFGDLLDQSAQTRPEVLALRNKVVIVGAGYAGNNDVHPTPYSNTLGAADHMMSGPEIQANIVETLLSGRAVQHAPWGILALIVATAAWGLAYALFRFGIAWGMVTLVTACALFAWGAYRAFLGDMEIPVAQMQLAVVPALILAGVGKFSRVEREKRHLSSLFGRYVSTNVMQALIANPEMPGLGGRRRQVTVLFSDIRGFTTLSETLEPEEVVELLNEYFERVCAALLAEDATIDKFIGDAVMAEFGAPLDQPDHAERALRAALEVFATARSFADWVTARFPGRGLPPFAVGIGLNTGPAVMGNIGSLLRMEYTAVGDTVNIASRLEGLTQSVGCPILASAATLAAVTRPEDFQFGKHHHLSIKGKSGQVEAVEVWPVEKRRKQA
jgi:class 3 adenylate cyclase